MQDQIAKNVTSQLTHIVRVMCWANFEADQVPDAYQESIQPRFKEMSLQVSRFGSIPI